MRGFVDTSHLGGEQELIAHPGMHDMLLNRRKLVVLWSEALATATVGRPRVLAER